MGLFKLDKYDKYFIAFILVIITFFNVGQCFASDVEDVTIDTISGLLISQNSNYFASSSGGNISTFVAESGYKYTITTTASTSRIVVTSSDAPQVNVTYNILHVIDDPTTSSTYSFISNSNQYISINGRDNLYTVTREKVEGQASAINDLVDNVGVGQLWGVFESGIDFIGVVVLVAFGLFLIFLLVKKISKGKADF